MNLVVFANEVLVLELFWNTKKVYLNDEKHQILYYRHGIW